MPVFRLAEAPLFPPVEEAEPNGMLAIGGDLSPERLIRAYKAGIFPWNNPDEPILWWSPNPRMVLQPGEVRVSKSMRPTLNQNKFEISTDRAFAEVIEACGKTPRPGQSGTWISDEMKAAYLQLHELGYAHSVEAWKNGKLAGGLYGVAIGNIFFGESMFSKVSNASKAAFITFCDMLNEKGYRIIDCQIYTDHLSRLGAYRIDRSEFCRILSVEAREELRPVTTWKEGVPEKIKAGK